MPEFKEKPKMDRPKAKPPSAMHPKQAARMMKEKYLQQLDQSPEGADSEASYATGQVEGAGRWAADEAMSHVPRPRQLRGNAPKGSSQPKDKSHFGKGSTTQGKPSGSHYPRQQSVYSTPQAAAPKQAPPTSARNKPITKAPHLQGNAKNIGASWDRSRTIFKTRSGPTFKHSAPKMKVKPPVGKVTKKAARQATQRQMTQRMIAHAQHTAKTAMTAAIKMAAAVIRAAVALVSGLVGLLGGGVLLIVLIFVVIIGAIASSPFGIFFAGGSGGSSAPPTVSTAEAVAQINIEYNAALEAIQADSYDSIDVTGTAADWPDVLAVFASRYAAAEDGVDVATLDADRVGKLTAVFWDMTDLTSDVETINHPDSDPDDDVDDSWVEHILHITVTPKTAQEMETVYGFTPYQKDAMAELLADRGSLASLAGSLDITNSEAQTVLKTLPEDLSPDRRRAVETALQLVGKVNYFWGGKSYVIGWDSRWGQLAKVTAPGSTTTGTYRPFGLDCSGFMYWALHNAGLPADRQWHIGTNLTPISQAEALPGDMALPADESHVGMVVGRDEDGNLLICHCSYGYNNVVVTEFIASGFTTLGRPSIYT